MQRLIVLVWALVGIHGFLSGQSLDFSLYDTFLSGKKPFLSHYFNLYSPSDSIYLLGNQDEDFPLGKYYFLIDRWEGDTFQAWDSRAVRLDSSSKFVSLKFSFRQPGEYQVRFMDSLRQVLDTDTLTLSLYNLAVTPEYYRKGKLSLCFRSKNGQALDTLESLNLGWEPIKIHLLYNLGEPLRVRGCYVDVWRKTEKDPKPLYQETALYKVRQLWEYSQFPYEIEEAGEYTFHLFTEENVYLGSAHLSVNQSE